MSKLKILEKEVGRGEGPAALTGTWAIRRIAPLPISTTAFPNRSPRNEDDGNLTQTFRILDKRPKFSTDEDWLSKFYKELLDVENGRVDI